MRAGAAWEVLEGAGRAGQLYPLRKTLGENACASWWKTTRGDDTTEGPGGFLGLLDVLTHVGCDPWCSRGPCRASVAAIFRWATTCAGTIGDPAWTGFGLHVLHALPLRKSLGCRERYRTSGNGGAHVSCPPPPL